MDTEARLKQVMDVLDQIAEDTSVPRNIRRGAAEAKARLAKKNEALDLRVTSAIMIMDDLANDPNIPLHGRTLIWNAISQREAVKPAAWTVPRAGIEHAAEACVAVVL